MRKKLDVEHFLGIYQIRKRCQDEGITNPSQEVKDITKSIIEQLSKMLVGADVPSVTKTIIYFNKQLKTTSSQNYRVVDNLRK